MFLAGTTLFWSMCLSSICRLAWAIQLVAQQDSKKWVETLKTFQGLSQLGRLLLLWHFTDQRELKGKSLFTGWGNTLYLLMGWGARSSCQKDTDTGWRIRAYFVIRCTLTYCLSSDLYWKLLRHWFSPKDPTVLFIGLLILLDRYIWGHCMNLEALVCYVKNASHQIQWRQVEEES